MNPDEPAEGTCIVCGKDLAAGPNFAHLYHQGRRFSLCCPMCVQMFQRAPARFAAGERPQSIIEQLLDELKWREPGR